METMPRYELCIGTDNPGGGAVFAALEEAKVAGWAQVGPVDGEGLLALPFEGFFTVHEIRSDGTPVMVFDSRNEQIDA